MNFIDMTTYQQFPLLTASGYSNNYGLQIKSQDRMNIQICHDVGLYLFSIINFEVSVALLLFSTTFNLISTATIVKSV